MATYQLTINSEIQSGTAGADTFDGYVGDDGLGATGGADSLSGLGGDDLFLIATDAVVTSGAVNGGDGVDTVRAYGFDLGDLSFEEVEVLSLEAAEFSATLSQLTSFATVTGSAERLKFYLIGTGGEIDASSLVAAGKSIELDAVGLGGGYDATGTGLADIFNGSNFDDTVHGGGGADTISGVHQDGGSGGTDQLFGDDGADVFQLRRQSGVIDGGNGVDTVVAFQTNAGFGSRFGDLGDATFVDVEKLVAGPNITYATLAQLNAFATITGGDADKLIRFDLSGGPGGTIDVSGKLKLAGEHIWLRAFDATSAVVVTGSNGDDVLSGSDFSDRLTGGLGDDYLEGASFTAGPSGRDTLTGGEGDDVYYVDRGDRLVDLVGPAGGVDTVISTESYDLADAKRLDGEFENLTLNGYLGAENPDTRGYGNALGNVITGNGGDNLLDGRAGADTLIGGSGDDIFVVDDTSDIVRESDRGDEGVDTVRSSVEFDLADGVRVSGFLENLDLRGDGDINGFGSESANRMTGNAGDNVLDGRAGADTMAGGLGNDVYYVDEAGDLVVEKAGRGIDTVYAGASFSLAKQSVENLYLTSSEDFRATGNALANTISGNDGDNAIRGRDGADTLTGGDGRDTFVFDAPLSAANVDRILDFVVRDDRIRLEDGVFAELSGKGRLDAEAFAFTSDGLAVETDDRIVYDTTTGDLFYDADGSGAGAGGRFAILSIGLTTLSENDFVVG